MVVDADGNTEYIVQLKDGVSVYKVRTEVAANGVKVTGEIHGAMPDVTFGAVSLQLRSLTEAGLVEARSSGRHRFYRARRDELKPVARMLEQMWDDALWRLKLAAELENTRRGPRPRRRPLKTRKG